MVDKRHGRNVSGPRKCIGHHPRRQAYIHEHRIEKVYHQFYPSHDESFGETYTAEGGDTVNIHGRVIGDVLEAEVTNYGTDPPCEHHWHLKKQ
jgi:hypothetical protein